MSHYYNLWLIVCGVYFTLNNLFPCAWGGGTGGGERVVSVKCFFFVNLA